MPSDSPISHDSFERTALRCTPQSWTAAEIAQFVANLGLASTYAPLDSPEFTTPVLGVATATSINKVTITAPATSAVLTIADGKTLTVSNTITLTGTDAASYALNTMLSDIGDHTTLIAALETDKQDVTAGLTALIGVTPIADGVVDTAATPNLTFSKGLLVSAAA